MMPIRSIIVGALGARTGVLTIPLSWNSYQKLETTVFRMVLQYFVSKEKESTIFILWWYFLHIANVFALDMGVMLWEFSLKSLSYYDTKSTKGRIAKPALKNLRLP